MALRASGTRYLLLVHSGWLRDWLRDWGLYMVGTYYTEVGSGTDWQTEGCPGWAPITQRLAQRLIDRLRAVQGGHLLHRGWLRYWLTDWGLSRVGTYYTVVGSETDWQTEGCPGWAPITQWLAQRLIDRLRAVQGGHLLHRGWLRDWLTDWGLYMVGTYYTEVGSETDWQTQGCPGWAPITQWLAQRLIDRLRAVQGGTYYTEVGSETDWQTEGCPGWAPITQRLAQGLIDRLRAVQGGHLLHSGWLRDWLTDWGLSRVGTYYTEVGSETDWQTQGCPGWAPITQRLAQGLIDRLRAVQGGHLLHSGWLRDWLRDWGLSRVGTYYTEVGSETDWQTEGCTWWAPITQRLAQRLIDRLRAVQGGHLLHRGWLRLIDRLRAVQGGHLLHRLAQRQTQGCPGSALLHRGWLRDWGLSRVGTYYTEVGSGTDWQTQGCPGWAPITQWLAQRLRAVQGGHLLHRGWLRDWGLSRVGTYYTEVGSGTDWQTQGCPGWAPITGPGLTPGPGFKVELETRFAAQA